MPRPYSFGLLPIEPSSTSRRFEQDIRKALELRAGATRQGVEVRFAEQLTPMGTLRFAHPTACPVITVKSEGRLVGIGQLEYTAH